MDLSDVPASISGGAACFASGFTGDTSIPIYDSEGNTTGYCSSFTTKITFVYSLSGFAAGMTLLFVMKYGSATLYTIANTLSIPIASFMFSVPFLVQLVGLELLNTLGVLIVASGFTLYACSGIDGEQHKTAKGKAQLSRMSQLGGRDTFN